MMTGGDDVPSSAFTQLLLGELASELLSFNNHTLDSVVHEFWPDFATAVQTVEFPVHDTSGSKRRLAALFASRLYLQVGSFANSLEYALAACDLFDSEAYDGYVERIVDRCVDHLVRAKRDANTPLVDDSHLECVIDEMYQKCLSDGRHELVLRLALRTKRLDMLAYAVKSSDDPRKMLVHAMRLTMSTVECCDFRSAVLHGLICLHRNQEITDHISMSRCYIVLNDTKSIAQLLEMLIKINDNNSCLIAYQISFDLCELTTQQFQSCVLEYLKQTVHLHSNTQLSFKTHECNEICDYEIFQKLTKVLSGEISIMHYSEFLGKNNCTDIQILKNTRAAVYTSICHTATMIANGFMYSGTGNDAFLKDYLEMGNWTIWEIFSAIVSVGVIYRGHEKNSVQLICNYFSSTKLNASEYSEGGSLYALGLIHANHGVLINDYLLKQIKHSHYEVVKHGGCLGIGLSALGTNRCDIYEQLKLIMHQDNAVFGEAIGLAMGMIMLGSKNDEILQDMVAYAHLTQHERILRGLAVGISFLMYDQLDKADKLIESLLEDKNPILRCSAMYTISMAYCGTGSKDAIKKLLHSANFDVNDDVRCAAVIGLGFLLFRTPEQCLETIGVLSKSYNPYVRYGAAMALGIACAGTGLKETVDFLKPMITDLVNYVRQGALIASSLIFIHKTDKTCINVNYFRSIYAQVINDSNEDDVVKFGAILAQGIIDGGGQNVTISLETRTGHNHMLTVVGLMLFIQYQHCICLAHCLTLAFTPTCVVAVNTQLEMSVSKMICDSKQNNQKVCKTLCKELAEQRGWIPYLFNQNSKSKFNKNHGKHLEYCFLSYKILIPKIVQDLEVIKSNWQTGHFLLRNINYCTENSKSVICLQYDDNKIVSGSRDCTIQIWDKHTLECVKVLTGHSGSVLCLQFDEKVIISGSNDFTVRVWNIVSGDLINTLIYHRDSVLNLKCANNMMVTCSKDHSIVVWNMVSPIDINVRCVLIGHQTAVNVVTFDNKYIVSGSGDNLIKVWNTLTCEFVRSLMGHTFGIVSLQYKDRLVVSASFDKTIRLWDIEYGACLRVLEDCGELIVCVKFDNKVIISGYHDGKIKVWNLEAALDPKSSTSSLTLNTLKVHTDMIFDLQFDKFQVVSCSKDGTLLIWDFLNYNNSSYNFVNDVFNTDYKS